MSRFDNGRTIAVVMGLILFSEPLTELLLSVN